MDGNLNTLLEFLLVFHFFFFFFFFVMNFGLLVFRFQVFYLGVKTLIESGHEQVYDAVEKPLLFAQTAAFLEVNLRLCFYCAYSNKSGYSLCGIMVQGLSVRGLIMKCMLFLFRHFIPRKIIHRLMHNLVHVLFSTANQTPWGNYVFLCGQPNTVLSYVGFYAGIDCIETASCISARGKVAYIRPNVVRPFTGMPY